MRGTRRDTGQLPLLRIPGQHLGSADDGVGGSGVEVDGGQAVHAELSDPMGFPAAIERRLIDSFDGAAELDPADLSAACRDGAEERLEPRARSLSLLARSGGVGPSRCVNGGPIPERGRGSRVRALRTGGGSKRGEGENYAGLRSCFHPNLQVMRATIARPRRTALSFSDSGLQPVHRPGAARGWGGRPVRYGEDMRPRAWWTAVAAAIAACAPGQAERSAMTDAATDQRQADEHAARRARMVTAQLRGRDITHPGVLDAMGR